METKKKKILFIDDDNFLRAVFGKSLKDSGFEVETAENGKTGFEKLKTFSPDLVLLDLVMPEYTGFDFLKLKNEEGKHKDIPVVIVSSMAQQEDIERAMEMGAVDYMTKDSMSLRVADKKIEKWFK
ncbi:MAG: response regulator [Patescibacteria group bacterium]|nr:response regulator [Patescibacteria group bacterium]